MGVIRFAVLTVSDRCSAGLLEDLSGPKLKDLIVQNGWSVKEQGIVPDEKDDIIEKLINWSRIKSDIDVILTTGGTGFAPRDVTPEATLQVIERQANGIVTAMTIASLEKTQMAVLSRAVAGIKNQTLIINLPGSKKGVEECFNVIVPSLQHAIDLIRDRKEAIHKAHVSITKVKTTEVADRARKSPWPMISMNEANTILLSQIPKNLKTTLVPLKEALGRILSEDVTAQDPLPPFRASVKDGYAVISSDGVGPLKVLSISTAGISPNDINIKPGFCVRVNTGSPVPDNADAVVQVEDTQLLSKNTDGEEESILLLVKPKIGQDIREVGCDVAKGEKVLAKGAVINSPELGLLATVGLTNIPVYKLPKVAILSTGDELISPEMPLKIGAIRDSNKTVLMALLKENGFDAYDMGIAKDDPQALLVSLTNCLDICDVVLTTGSVSMGEKDYLKQVLQKDFNAQIHFGRINMKPGKPTTFATSDTPLGKKIFFCLPGNPVSATVTSHLFVIPFLKGMSGYTKLFPTEISVKMNFTVKLDDRPEYRRAHLEFSADGEIPIANQTGSQASSRLSSWRDANCLLVLPSTKESPEIKKGSIVKALIVTKI